jgi:hypothetical protein
MKDEKITKKCKGEEKRGVIQGVGNKEGQKKNQIANWIDCETMQTVLKASLVMDNGGFKTLPKVNGFEDMEGKNTSHRSKLLAHSSDCVTKMNKKVYKTSDCWYIP